MPIYDIQLSPPEALRVRGGIFAVQISLPQVLADYLGQRGLPVPPPVSGNALIDTGASVSVVDLSVLSSLEIGPISVVTVLTPTGSARQNLYPARFILPALVIDVTGVIGANLMPQNIVALIGRDILGRFLLIYHGPAGRVTLTY